MFVKPVYCCDARPPLIVRTRPVPAAHQSRSVTSMRYPKQLLDSFSLRKPCHGNIICPHLLCGWLCCESRLQASSRADKAYRKGQAALGLISAPHASRTPIPCIAYLLLAEGIEVSGTCAEHTEYEKSSTSTVQHIISRGAGAPVSRQKSRHVLHLRHPIRRLLQSTSTEHGLRRRYFLWKRRTWKMFNPNLS